ncbi:LacI family DNA-binding transcriptional regulator [Secundilactobacillus yichangensis]|uniref:LacI family DNA-binding transcriptional regulator n=1 Tax=Secundilactobacillus yichangensis TaxID=2799580 RepID=UPI001945909D|nr:LacI family DNA-binding transcriptional regulator [Secundilactobacillus yichangensis]
MDFKKPRVTINEIAELAGVSIATVSRALNNRPGISQRTKEKIQRIITQTGYQPNIFARNIREHQTKLIGLVISDASNEFFKQVSRAVQDQAALAGYSVIMLNSDENPAEEMQAIQILRHYDVSGLIIASTDTHLDYHQLVGDTPTVFFDRAPSPDKQSQFDTLLVNNVSGAEVAVSELIRQGATKIGILSSGVSTAGKERRQGYLKALAEYHLPLDEDLIYTSDVKQVKALDYAHELLVTHHCDGIFAADNTLLLVVLQEIKLLNRTGVKVATFDNTAWFDYFKQPVISVKQPTATIGHQAVDLVLKRINEPTLPAKTRRFSVQLIRRG